MTNIRNALMQAAGTAASGDPVYVEDVFATHLRVGTGSTTSNIDVGIDLSDKGGLVWTKDRNWGNGQHTLSDTVRGISSSSDKTLRSDSNAAEGSVEHVNSVSSTGYAIKGGFYTNHFSGYQFVDWVFAKQKGFFDIVTYTGNGSGDQTISHNLGSTPGFIAVKALNADSGWRVFHTSTGNTKFGYFDTSDISAMADLNWNATSTTFAADSQISLNTNARTYVAYLWASGTDSASQIFGDDGDEAIIKTGSYNGDGTTNGSKVIDTGFEPQWVMVKRTDGTGHWIILDNMRGINTALADASLVANSNAAENGTLGAAGLMRLTNAGFALNSTAINNGSQSYVYIAIRRGPMKEATAGTDLLDIESYTGNGNSTREFSLDITPDFIYQRNLGSSYNEPAIHFRVGSAIKTAGAVYTSNLKLDRTKGAHLSTSDDKINQNSESYIMYAFKRFPKAIDILTYDSFDETSLSSFNQPHNLGVQPELMMFAPYYVAQGSTSVNGAFKMWWQLAADNKYSTFGGTDTAASWLADPTATHIPLSTNNNMSFYDVPGPNVKGFIVILMASVEGMIKIGEYSHAASGDYTTVSVTTGFQPRFIMLQHDDNGSWTQFDSVQGLSSSNNPHFEWASTSAQTTSVDVFQSISSTGFVVEHAGGGNSASFNYGGSGRKTRYIAIA